MTCQTQAGFGRLHGQEELACVHLLFFFARCYFMHVSFGAWQLLSNAFPSLHLIAAHKTSTTCA
jgi:hypothetical protein